MTEQKRYSNAWRDRSRRGVLTISVLFGGAVLLIAPMVAIDAPHREKYAVALLLGKGGWLAASLAAAIYQSRFRRPGAATIFLLIAKVGGFRRGALIAACHQIRRPHRKLPLPSARGKNKLTHYQDLCALAFASAT